MIELQTKLAHQEHTIAALNEAVTGQQAQIARLEQLVMALTDRVKALSESVPGGDEGHEVPPHY